MDQWHRRLMQGKEKKRKRTAHYDRFLCSLYWSEKESVGLIHHHIGCDRGRRALYIHKVNRTGGAPVVFMCLRRRLCSHSNSSIDDAVVG